MRRWRRATVLLSLATMGCSTENSVGIAPPPDPGGPGMLPMAPPDPSFTFPDGVTGDWTGYFQAYMLPSGSDAIALKMGQNADGANEIQLVLGAGPAPAPATDGTAQWPSPPRAISGYGAGNMMEGFPYVAHQVRWEGKRLRFSVTSNAPWQPWCVLQTSYPYGSSQYGCVPSAVDCRSTASDPQGNFCHALDGSGAVVTSAQLSQCQHCACDAAECIAQPIPDQSFDITFDSDTAASGAGLSQTLRLMK